MRTKLVSIGNSKGIRIPKPLLKESGFDDEVELRVGKGRITLVPVKKSRVSETALLSEPALARDWNRPEEDEAWKDL